MSALHIHVLGRAVGLLAQPSLAELRPSGRARPDTVGLRRVRMEREREGEREKETNTNMKKKEI